MNIVERITALCQREGTTKGTIEKELSLSHGVIQKWENHDPSATALFKVASRFNVSMEYLLTGEAGQDQDKLMDYYQCARRIYALPKERQKTILDAIELQEYQYYKETREKERLSNA